MAAYIDVRVTTLGKDTAQQVFYSRRHRLQGLAILLTATGDETTEIRSFSREFERSSGHKVWLHTDYAVRLA